MVIGSSSPLFKIRSDRRVYTHPHTSYFPEIHQIAIWFNVVGKLSDYVFEDDTPPSSPQGKDWKLCHRDI